MQTLQKLERFCKPWIMLHFKVKKACSTSSICGEDRIKTPRIKTPRKKFACLFLLKPNLLPEAPWHHDSGDGKRCFTLERSCVIQGSPKKIQKKEQPPLFTSLAHPKKRRQGMAHPPMRAEHDEVTSPGYNFDDSKETLSIRPACILGRVSQIGNCSGRHLRGGNKVMD